MVFRSRLAIFMFVFSWEPADNPLSPHPCQEKQAKREARREGERERETERERDRERECVAPGMRHALTTIASKNNHGRISGTIVEHNINNNNNNNNNKVARASAAARGASFMFGRYFRKKTGRPCVLRGFREQDDVSGFSFSHVFCSCFLVAFWRKCRKYHAFRVL